MTDISRAEICAVACADAWRGDGEIVASPMGFMPMIGARLARATFEPDLLLSDGEATFCAGTWAIDAPAPVDEAEGYIPYRAVFDLVWSGRRHVMMGPSQIDRFGNANISAIGPFAKPTRQLLGVRGAPGNTINHATSYWVPKHSTRSFVEAVDMVSGVGFDHARAAGNAGRFVDIRRVVTNLAVLDFSTDNRSMRLASVHPGVTEDEVLANTGFSLVVPATVSETRMPTDEELRLIREVIDPNGLRNREVPS